MPVILGTQEAAIWRIMVRSLPQANSSQDPILKNPITKNGLMSGQGVGPECKPQYHQKNNNNMELYQIVA
jgi:hypothetical protein